MIRLPVKYRSSDDDHAPVDYQFVGSVAEGRQKREADVFQRAAGKAVVRRHVEPDQRVDHYGTHARRSHVVPAEKSQDMEWQAPAMRNGAKVQRIVYPERYTPQSIENTQPPSPWDTGEEMPKPGDDYGFPAAFEEEPVMPEANDSFPPPVHWGEAPVGPVGPEGEAFPAFSQNAVMPEADDSFPSPVNWGEAPVGPEGEAFPAFSQNAVMPEANDSFPPPVNWGEAPEAPVGPEGEAFLAFSQNAVMPEADDSFHSPVGSEIPLAQPEFTAPVAPEIPEWLRVANQNSLSPSVQRLRPRVTAAPLRSEEEEAAPLGRPARGQAKARNPFSGLPQTAADYALAGYPEELLLEQEKRDWEQQAERYSPNRHGAQHASAAHNRRQSARRATEPAAPQGPARPSLPDMPAEDANFFAMPTSPQAPSPYDQADSGPSEYPRPRQRSGAYLLEAEDAPQSPRKRDSGRSRPSRGENEGRGIPWLGIAAAVLTLAAVLLWVLQATYARRTEALFEERAQAEQATLNAHPYQYRQLVETQSQIYNLHPAFVAAIILNESSFNPMAESSVGARGLMQMMPDTAEWVHGKIGEGASYHFDMMYDADTNVHYACWYMNFLSEKFRGDPVLVAAAFHAGQGTVQNWLNDSRYSADNQTIHLENMMDGPTKNYATRVLRAYAVYKRLYYEEGRAPAL